MVAVGSMASVRVAVVVDRDVDTVQTAVAAADAVDSRSDIVNVKMSQSVRAWCCRQLIAEAASGQFNAGLAHGSRVTSGSLCLNSNLAA